jgi:AcrR family transcriptional regulator
MSDRLSADDWIKAGLKALAAEGFTTLKADALAKTLGVSRGSFYWHFADVDAFHVAVLAGWQAVAAAGVIRAVDDLDAGEDRLMSLLRRAFTGNASLEMGVRAWAASNGTARAVVDNVDRQRLGYIEALLRTAGVGAARAGVRAQILYWTYLGAAMAGRKLSRRQFALLLDELARLGRGDGEASGRIEEQRAGRAPQDPATPEQA